LRGNEASRKEKKRQEADQVAVAQEKRDGSRRKHQVEPSALYGEDTEDVD